MSEPLSSVPLPHGPAGTPGGQGGTPGGPTAAPGGPTAAPGGPGVHHARRTAVKPGVVGRPPVVQPPSRRRGLSTAQMALLTFAALVMGILALLRVNSGALGDLGLISVAGPTYFAAVALVLLSFGFALVQQPLRRPLLAFQIVGLIVLLDGLGPLVEPHASFATAWLHAGFSQYIAQTGHTLPTLDARFSWPGFFALAAVLSKVAGLHSPESFLAWAPLVFNLMYLPPLYAICRAVTRNERVWWMALALFYLAS
ncbi:MAG TPA: hypothetical protein VKY26_03600, partial [Actinomycetota bacterium]|nr:hypothetical protein [Actinomycetota bacterium]